MSFKKSQAIQWAVSAVIDRYNSQGSEVYGCAIDLSKAFAMVSCVSLFKTLQARAVLPIFLRINPAM